MGQIFKFFTFFYTFSPQDSVGINITKTSSTIKGDNITSPSPNLGELFRFEKEKE